MKAFLKRLINKILNVTIQRLTQDIKFERSRQSLLTTVSFIDENLPITKSVNSKWQVLDLAIDSITIEGGSYLEFGVFNGESLNYIAGKLGGKTVYGFDSFQGLPENWTDGSHKGHFKVKSIPKVRENCELVQGWFNESIPKFLENHQINSISFLHIDADLYSSTKVIFDYLSDFIKSGTIIVFDEFFNYPGWKEHEYKAFTEFITHRQDLTYEFLTYNNMGQQLAVKII